MLTLVFKLRKSRSKNYHFRHQKMGYPHLVYLLAICLHEINIFYTGY